MAKHIVEYTFAEAWQALLTKIITLGKPVSPRDQGTREITNVTLEVIQGLSNILYNSDRKLNYRFMIAEWLWIQGGLEDLESLAQYNSVIRNFSDDGQILNGAYGPRLSSQWNYIFDTLEKQDSRQAVATIWTPSPRHSKDIPCTISLQWMIRDGGLHCTVNMRSSDVWLGLPYDFFTFSQLTNLVSSIMEVPVGSITMNLASSHLYNRDLEQGTKAMFNSNFESIGSPPLPAYGLSPVETFYILNRDTNIEITGIWEYYAVALRKNSETALQILRQLERSYNAPQ